MITEHARVVGIPGFIEGREMKVLELGEGLPEIMKKRVREAEGPNGKVAERQKG